MALYRKYRPTTFAEVVGQEHVTEPLSAALNAGRINHAYLFSGPRGCGKTSSARILARSLNCVTGPTATPCGTCDSCVSLAPGGSGNLDVTELDAASHGGVNDARELRDRAFFSPSQSRYRVFIVDEAHMVSKEGFNALLKVVEEPPAHLIFVFATTEPEKVLATIKSRTHHYPFRLLAPQVMRGLLENVCANEGVVVDPAAYSLVIRAGAGSPRDSLSVLDQLVAGSGPDGVTYQDALALLGVTDLALLDDAAEALAAGDGGALFSVVGSVVESGHDPRRFAADLLERLRDLMLIKAIPDAGKRGLIDAPDDALARLRDQAERCGAATLARQAEILHTGLGEMRGTASPRLLLEVVCARMVLPAADASDSALLQRLEALERGGVVAAPASVARHVAAPPAPAARDLPAAPAASRAGSGREAALRVAAEKAAKPVVQPVPEPVHVAEPVQVSEPEPLPVSEPKPEQAPLQTPEQAAQPGAATAVLDLAAVTSALPKIRAAIRERNKTAEALFAGAQPVGVQGNVVTLSHPSAGLVSRLSEEHNAAILIESFAAALGQPVQVTWSPTSKAPQATITPKATASPAPGERPQFVRKSAAPAQSVSAPEVSPMSPDEEEMFAESGDPAPERRPVDPDTAALQLLRSELGARPIDRPGE